MAPADPFQLLRLGRGCWCAFLGRVSSPPPATESPVAASASLCQDLLKHTPEEHPDHPFLMEAQRSIKQVAERINKGTKSAEEVERNARIVQEIESHIEGMEDVRGGRGGLGGLPESRRARSLSAPAGPTPL